MDQLRTTGARYRVEVLRTAAQLRDARVVWSSLAPRRDADPEFVAAICEWFDATIRPHVLVGYEDDVPRAILPGRLDMESFPLRFGYVRLSLPRAPCIVFVHGGAIGELNRELCDAFVESALASLRNGEAHRLSFSDLDVEGPLYASVCAAIARPLRRLIPRTTHYVGTVRPKNGGFLASLTSKERYNFNSRARRLLSTYEGKIAIETFTSEDDVEKLVEHAELIARQSYQRSISVGFADTPVMRSRLAFEAQRGWLRGFVLYVDGKPSSFWICSLVRGVLQSEFMAYESSLAEYRPGIYLVVQALERLCREQPEGSALTLDLGSGEADWKRAMVRGQHIVNSTVSLFAPSIQGQAIRCAWLLFRIADLGARDVLRRGELIGTLKRRWRQRLRPGSGG